jgi:hypothetical protein
MIGKTDYDLAEEDADRITRIKRGAGDRQACTGGTLFSFKRRRIADGSYILKLM